MDHPGLPKTACWGPGSGSIDPPVAGQIAGEFGNRHLDPQGRHEKPAAGLHPQRRNRRREGGGASFRGEEEGEGADHYLSGEVHRDADVVQLLDVLDGGLGDLGGGGAMEGLPAWWPRAPSANEVSKLCFGKKKGLVIIILNVASARNQGK